MNNDLDLYALHAQHLSGRPCADIDRELGRSRGYTSRLFHAHGLHVRSASSSNTLAAERRRAKIKPRPLDPIRGVPDDARARIKWVDGVAMICLVNGKGKNISGGYIPASVYERVLWRQLEELKRRQR